MAFHLLLSRMNPSISACIFGNADTVLPDDEGITSDETSSSCDSPVKNLGGGSKFSFGCLSTSPKSYIPNDTVQPLSNDVILLSLERVVPEYLAIIASRPPSSSSGAFSEKEMRKMNKQFNLNKTVALQKLHDLTIKAHEYNRIPLLQTDKWDIIAALSTALIESCHQIIVGTDNQSMDENRRLICWTINNLSIPYENKATIVKGRSLILQALMMVIESNLPESYLACITINNLTFLADAIKPVALYVPPANDSGAVSSFPSLPKSRSSRQKYQANPLARQNTIRSRSFSTNGRSRSGLTKRSRSLSSNGLTVCCEGEGWDSEVIDNVLGNPSSLLRTIERMMVTNAPFLLSDVKSVQGEAIRWACGFIRNVTNGEEKIDSNVPSPRGRKGRIPDHSVESVCLLISRTEIPRLVIQFVRESPHPSVKWIKDSLEDICLGIICNIARFSSRESLIRAGAAECLEKIEALPGIHGYRARAVLVSLGALPKQF
eukprot:CAMPEP_0201721976 /NCGR_PEP_ID=MMETSP0593-20130828/6479_1 /ASSEMBLY_ACC=CAM_ASM_000672 /TAXON_ID=267983 /ORGANISM="Skeletonema japonicum, Strain CCMP2506" /LENGTH=489 /DNA_ID=CAMNT_0048212863 /DNA_START=18 /DNA_END=1487 /DNA_ORIENTATION=+